MTDELLRFAESFKSEAELRKQIATLLGKVSRNQGIEITHGTQELGKDIIFYSRDGMDEWVLNACVVKLDKITGSVDDNQGARNVFHQVNQALDTPLIGGTGEHKNVARVYVISPYDCSQIAMRSIEGMLDKRSGQVSFLCGQRLLDKFVEVWPEFLIFESSLLGSYVAEMQKALDQNDPLAFLFSQHHIFSITKKSFSKTYVKQGFRKSLARVRLVSTVSWLKSLKRPTNEGDFNNVLQSLTFASSLVGHPQTWQSGEVEEAESMSFALEILRQRLTTEWQRRYLQERRAAHRGARVPVADSLSRIFTETITSKERDMLQSAHDLVTDFAKHVESANDFVKPHEDFLPLLHSESHLNYCRVHEVVAGVPSAFEIEGKEINIEFSENMLDKLREPVLITAAAGHGKTSFCRWNMLADLTQLSSKSSERIPIYVPLHQLAIAESSDYQELFLRSAEVRELFQNAHVNNRPVRMYLDGLDEVASIAQQKKLMNVAEALRKKFSNVQIIVTGRDYVSGPWLRWLARVSLSKFTDAQITQLISNWLGDDPETREDFETQLASVRTLRPLMSVPLLGTLIIAVYKKMKSLPTNKVQLYEAFVELMCGGWDVAKNIRREVKYGSNIKASVLTRLAGRLQLAGNREATEYDVRASVENTLYKYSERWRSILDEILEDGLLIRVGGSLAFCHLSFQEYLAAKDLADPTGKRPQIALGRFFAGEDRWREVLSFYVAMSNRPDEVAEWVREGHKNTKRVDRDDRLGFLLQSIEAGSPGWTRTLK